MNRLIFLLLSSLLLASAAQAIAGPSSQYQKIDSLGHPVGPVTDYDPDAKRELSWFALLICGGFTAFVVYEYYRQEALGPYVMERTERVIYQWVERSEHPLFFWIYMSVHAALATYFWWHCFFG
ncbi:MAG TPA: hypothetical protein VGP63_04530 [Planctomycetaceae bacterium]|jgi:hypothetical protein|nr:hypothetical protein [Planctomycetaceae bacterium]